MPSVLVVDDSAVDRRLAGGLLEKNTDFSVFYANDGTEALKELDNRLPDLILTDMQMPKMDGLELVKRVKQDYPLIPVILMTAQGSEEIAVQALEVGAASYVPKRALNVDLLEIVERVLATASEERGTNRLMSRMTDSECSFVLENDVTLISSLASYLRQTVRGMGIGNESDHLRLGIALEEALLNAYYHGNLEVSSELREVDYSAYYKLANERCFQEPYQDRRIYVSARFSPTEVSCTIRDEGPGFDPFSLPDPRDPMNIDIPSGRGVLLMRTFMDDVAYNEEGNEVTLTKRYAPVEEEMLVDEAGS